MPAKGSKKTAKKAPAEPVSVEPVVVPVPIVEPAAPPIPSVEPAPVKSGMTTQEINSRTKDNSYITLNKKTIEKIIKQLDPARQNLCFSGSKIIKPLNKYEASYLLSETPDLDSIDDRPISKIPLVEKRSIIKTVYGTNEAFKIFVDDENLGLRAVLLEEKTEKGDFSPSGLWDILDEMIADLDLSKIGGRKSK